MSYLTMYRGDDRTLTITADEDLTGSVVTFTAKRAKRNTTAVLSKSTTDGGIVLGDPATTAIVTIDAADTADLRPVLLHWDVQVVDDDDKVHTVATGKLAVLADITGGGSWSQPPVEPSALAAHVADADPHTGYLTTAEGDAAYDALGAAAAHEADTTNVHGIADTANLVRTLPPSNGVDDTAVIQAALDTARLTFEPALVKGLPGENYIITTIIIGAYTTLDMTGCTVTQVDGTDTNMVRNWSFAASRTLQDAAMTAGSKTFTSATANFTAGDDEHALRVWGAGQGGAPLDDWIESVVNSTTVELYTAASTTITAGQATVRQWDIGITVKGGVWDRGDNGRMFLYEPGHDGDELYRIQDSSGFGMLFRRLSFLTVKDVIFKGGNSLACTALCIGDATNFLADNISTPLYLSGLVQVTGPARFGTFSNIAGRCTDDLAAILPVDWFNGVRDVWGDVAYISFENIHSEFCGGSLVIMCPGSASLGISLEHVYIRNVTGMDTNITQQQGGLVSIADTYAFPDMPGGFIDDIVVENVSGEPMGDYPLSRGLVWLGAQNMGRIRLSGLNIHTPTGSERHGVILGPDTDIGYLTISDSVISSIDGGCDLVNYDEAVGSVIQNVGLARNAYRVNGVWSLITDVDVPTYAWTLVAIPDLLLYWRLGEPSGVTATDAFAAYDGTYNGSPTLGATGLIAGDADTAWTGNGTNANIAGPTIPAQAAWTIAFWAKHNGVNTDYAGIFSTPGDQFDIALIGSGYPAGTLAFYDGGSWVPDANIVIDATATFIAYTYDATNGLTYYKNGAVVLNAPTKGRALLNAAFTVGSLGGAFTIDTLDEFTIFSRALTLSEIASLYSVGS